MADIEDFAGDNLVAPDWVCAQLRADNDADATWLGVATPAICRAVVAWCGGDIAKLRDDKGWPLPDVAQAVLVECAWQYAHREGPEAAYIVAWYAQGYTLSAGATALLQQYRCPVVA